MFFSSIRSYADDCVLYSEVSFSAMFALQSDLDEIEAWCFQLSIFFNLSKRVHIRFTIESNFCSLLYTIGVLPVELLAEAEYLARIFHQIYLGTDILAGYISAEASRSLGYI